MWNLTKLICHKNASALGLGGRFENPLFYGVGLHSLLQILKLIRKNESCWQEHEMLGPVNLPKLGYRLVHQILPRYIKRAWKVIYFLVPIKLLVSCILNRADVPNYGCVWLLRRIRPAGACSR